MRSKTGKSSSVWNADRQPSVIGLTALALLCVLGGCANSPGLSLTSPAGLEQPPSGAAGPKWSLVSLQGISGATPGFTQQLVRSLNGQAQEKSIALLVDPGSSADLRIEGILSLTRNKNGQGTLRYAWIVRDVKGVAVQTVDGSETVKMPRIEQDAWNWIPVSVADGIAASAVVAMLPHLKPSEIVAGSLDATTRPQ